MHKTQGSISSTKEKEMKVERQPMEWEKIFANHI
jgi:hypothetical protein